MVTVKRPDIELLFSLFFLNSVFIPYGGMRNRKTSQLLFLNFKKKKTLYWIVEKSIERRVFFHFSPLSFCFPKQVINNLFGRKYLRYLKRVKNVIKYLMKAYLCYRHTLC